MSTAILWINAFGAAAACVANLWAAVTGWREWRFVRWTVAAFAGFYSVSYATFACGVWTLQQWSGFMRGVSIPVWFVVWCWPAVHSARMWRKIVREASRE